jgi:hypothetical protein
MTFVCMLEMVATTRKRKIAASLLVLNFIRNRNVRRYGTRPMNRLRLQKGEFHSLVPDLRNQDPARHFNYFRMSSNRFDDLLQRISPQISRHKTHKQPISAAERLSATLKFLSSGTTQQSIAIEYRIGKSTMNKLVYDCCKAIWEGLKEEFVPVPDVKKWKDIAADFWRLWQFPNCLGAIDGKHVRLKAPANCGSQYCKSENLCS